MGQGHVPQIHLLPSPSPDSKASWPFWRDFWGPKMLQNPNFPGGAYSAPPEPLADGRGSLPSPKNPTPALASRPFGLVSTGLRV